MTWFDILKKVTLMNSEELRNKVPNFQTAQEKGYPSNLNNLTYVVDMTQDGEVTASTSYMDFGKFYFVGNGKSYSRGDGNFKRVLSARNSMVDKPQITLLNPKGDTSLARLHSMVINRGWSKVESYDDVDDIMTESTYILFSDKLPMYRSRDK